MESTNLFVNQFTAPRDQKAWDFASAITCGLIKLKKAYLLRLAIIMALAEMLPCMPLMGQRPAADTMAPVSHQSTHNLALGNYGEPSFDIYGCPIPSYFDREIATTDDFTYQMLENGFGDLFNVPRQSIQPALMHLSPSFYDHQTVFQHTAVQLPGPVHENPTFRAGQSNNTSLTQISNDSTYTTSCSDMVDGCELATVQKASAERKPLAIAMDNQAQPVAQRPHYEKVRTSAGDRFVIPCRHPGCSSFCIGLDHLMLHLKNEHNISGGKTSKKRVAFRWNTVTSNAEPTRTIEERQYLREIHKLTNVSFQCNASVKGKRCGRIYSRQDSLQKHWVRVHGRRVSPRWSETYSKRLH
ncbi:hypothetical protein CVT26_012382 [Gymnopilus dilepis]|uniref:C2H2-type domain-containing protein n=1 Tax=Gymnopilus dilepis TaxID=231916 RepID=A0A409WAQ1_9AGAR|nr:hypothetical protein CVT26_012382 [Gymnopilus dilepis]